MKLNRKTIIYQMILTAMFAALACVATMYIKIPLGPSKIHLGNFVCILASLLVDGVTGGFAGSIGMGLADLLSGYGIDTILRTFIVKFALGYFAGFAFHKLYLSKKDISKSFIIFAFIFIVISIPLSYIYFAKNGVIAIGSRTFKVSLILLILTYVFDVLFIILHFIQTKLSSFQKNVFFVVICANLLNIILEFILKIPFKMIWAEMNFNQAFAYSLSSLPAALLTAITTTIMISLIYFPVYYATRKFNKLNKYDF